MGFETKKSRSNSHRLWIIKQSLWDLKRDGANSPQLNLVFIIKQSLWDLKLLCYNFRNMAEP